MPSPAVGEGRPTAWLEAIRQELEVLLEAWVFRMCEVLAFTTSTSPLTDRTTACYKPGDKAQHSGGGSRRVRN